MGGWSITIMVGSLRDGHGDGDLREFARIENGGMQLNQPPLGLGRWKDTGQA